MKTKSRTEPQDKPDNEIGGAYPWSQAVFRELVDNISDGVYCINIDGYFVYVNRAITERSGMPPDKFYKSHFLDIVHSSYHDQAAQNFQRVMSGETGILYEVGYESADGQRMIVQINTQPIRRDGKVIGLLGISRNITERKQAEEALKASEQKYRKLMENASDAILLADTQGNIVEANSKAEELWGYTKEELLQMHYTELHPMPEMERTIATFKEIIKKSTDHLSGGFIQRKDGDIVPVDITGSVIEDPGRKIVQGFFRDISEHKQAKDQLEKLVKERTTELSRNYEQLKLEIKERRSAEVALRKKTNELQLKSGKFEEINIALKILLQQREEEMTELEGKVISNVKYLLSPHLEKLKKRKVGRESKMHLDILESNLHNIVSSFSQKLSSKHINLTPTEIKVANLVREGKTSKEIAEFLGSSPSSINIHRFHIRRKLGLIGKETNLQSYLTSLS